MIKYVFNIKFICIYKQILRKKNWNQN